MIRIGSVLQYFGILTVTVDILDLFKVLNPCTIVAKQNFMALQRLSKAHYYSHCSGIWIFESV